MGVSGDTFYRYQEAVSEGGVDALLNRNCRVPNEKNRVDKTTEDAVIAYAVEQPAHGQHRTRNELRKRERSTTDDNAFYMNSNSSFIDDFIIKVFGRFNLIISSLL